MTISEIFSNMSKHQVEGLMLHNDFADYFRFLDMNALSDIHEKQYIEESCTMREMKKFYIEHYQVLLPNTPINAESYIPSSWRSYARPQIDNDTKKSGVKNALEKWEKWETETKALYQQLYGELLSVYDIVAAQMVSDLIKGVDNELMMVRDMIARFKMSNYSLDSLTTLLWN